MTPETAVAELQSIRTFFNRSTSVLTDDDSELRPSDGMYSTKQQFAHVAQTIDWFLAGAFGPGFNMNFEGLNKELDSVSNLSEARQWFERSIDSAVARLASTSQQELESTLPADCVLGAVPRAYIVGAIADHTAHHRGALTVYARLQGKVPAMPYMEG